jgi:hypothetical protein
MYDPIVDCVIGAVKQMAAHSLPPDRYTLLEEILFELSQTKAAKEEASVN